MKEISITILAKLFFKFEELFKLSDKHDKKSIFNREYVTRYSAFNYTLKLTLGTLIIIKKKTPSEVVYTLFTNNKSNGYTVPVKQLEIKSSEL